MKVVALTVAVVGLVAIGTALRVAVAGERSERRRDAGTIGLFLRCLGWGIATGAVTGAVIGTILGLLLWRGDDLVAKVVGLPLAGALYGSVIGALVAVIPTVLGGVVVACVIRRRHPDAAAEDVVRRDLGAVFAACVGVLDAGLLLAVFTVAKGGSSVAVALGFLAVGNTCVVLMLWWARGSISRSWARTGS